MLVCRSRCRILFVPLFVFMLGLLSCHAVSAGPDHDESKAGGKEPQQTQTDEHGKSGADEKSSAKADHHDPNDLTHANAAANLTAPEEYKYDLSIYTFVVFLLLLLILGKFAWGPIVQGLDKREQGIADQIEEAKQGAEKATQTLEQYQAKLAAATEEVKELMAQARRDAESAKERILSEAQEAAERERERALSDIEAAKNKALTELAQKSVDTAVALAARVVRKEINPDDHANLIKESLQQFPSRN